MHESFWWWKCSDRYIISLFPHLHSPVPNKPYGFCGCKASWKRERSPPSPTGWCLMPSFNNRTFCSDLFVVAKAKRASLINFIHQHYNCIFFFSLLKKKSNQDFMDSETAQAHGEPQLWKKRKKGKKKKLKGNKEFSFTYAQIDANQSICKIR